MTRRERWFAVVVNDTMRSRFNVLKPNSKAALAASLAKPFPQCAKARRQPISTAGMKGVGYSVLTDQPTKAASDYLVCGVVGHLQAGMWDRLTISSSAKVPSLVLGKPTKKLP